MWVYYGLGNGYPNIIEKMNKDDTEERLYAYARERVAELLDEYQEHFPEVEDDPDCVEDLIEEFMYGVLKTEKEVLELENDDLIYWTREG